MDRDWFQARVDSLIARESTEEIGWWMLTWSDENGFRGAAILPSFGILTATRLARGLGINPGGDVRGFVLPKEIGDPPVETTGRIITREEADHISARLLAGREQ